MDLFCHCRIAWPSQNCCPNLSPLVGPALSPLLRYCQTAPLLERTSVLPATLSALALAYILPRGATELCCSLASACFSFCWGFFIFNYYSADSFSMKQNSRFMEIGSLLFSIQQLSKKLIRHLLKKVLLSGVLISI